MPLFTRVKPLFYTFFRTNIRDWQTPPVQHQQQLQTFPRIAKHLVIGQSCKCRVEASLVFCYVDVKFIPIRKINPALGGILPISMNLLEIYSE